MIFLKLGAKIVASHKFLLFWNDTKLNKYFKLWTHRLKARDDSSIFDPPNFVSSIDEFHWSVIAILEVAALVNLGITKF